MNSHHIERRIKRIYDLGPRPIAEFVAEIAARLIAINPALGAEFERRLDKYAALDIDIVRDVGGNQFPAPPLRLVRR